MSLGKVSSLLSLVGVLYCEVTHGNFANRMRRRNNKAFLEDLPAGRALVGDLDQRAFSSFYENAWPFLKQNKIPFILFVSTEPVGKNGYMTWKQIKEVEREEFAFIGNHSHSHEYLIDFSFDDFKSDINQSINIFEKELGYNPVFYSPFWGIQFRTY